MNVGRDLASRIYLSGVIALTGTLAVTGVAIASSATKGATYVGTYAGRSDATAITFKVSANGKRVIDLSVTTPFKCNGGCGGVGSPSAGSASISKGGTFKVTLKIRALGSSNETVGTDMVTGKFRNGGIATGAVTSHFNKSSSGESVKWEAAS